MEQFLPRSHLLRSAVDKPKQATLPTNAMLTVTEACTYLRISKWTLYRLIQNKELKTVKIGSRRLVSLHSIQHFIEQRETLAGA